MSQFTSHATTSTVPLRAPLNAPKDFQSNPQSQSTYGLSGIIPSPVEKVTTTVPTPTTAPSQATNKNSQSACADLQPTSGGVPSAGPKPKPKKNQFRSLLSKLTCSSISRMPLSPPSSTLNVTPKAKTRTKTKVRTVPRPTQHMVAL